MAEDIGLCTHEKYHKHKLILFLSAMRSYRDELISNKFNVIYNDINQNKNLSYSNKIEKIIKYTKIDTLVLDSFIKNNANKELINIDYLKSIIIEFLINVLISFQSLLKKKIRKST